MTAVHAQSLEDVIRRAVAAYPAAAAARAHAESAGADLERARAARWPVIGLSAAGTSQERMPRPWVTGPQATYNLYSGGSIEAGIDRAQALVTAAEQRADTTFDEVALQAAEAYLAWARAIEQVALAQANVAVHERILDDVIRIVAVDPGRGVDQLQAQVRVDAARLALTQRTIERAQTAERLARYAGLALPLEPVGLDAEPGAAPASLEEALALVNDEHPQLGQLAAQSRAASAAVIVAAAQHHPRVDLSVSRALNPYTQMLDTVSQVNVTLAMFDGGAITAGVNAARAQERVSRLALDEGRLVVRERVASAWAEWQAAERRARLSDEQRATGVRLAQGYQEQFRLARRSLLDLLNIQNETFGYRVAALGARFDRRVARYRLSAAMGELARRHQPVTGVGVAGS